MWRPKKKVLFDMIFSGILGGDLIKQKQIDLVSCKISLLFYLEIALL